MTSVEASFLPGPRESSWCWKMLPQSFLVGEILGFSSQNLCIQAYLLNWMHVAKLCKVAKWCKFVPMNDAYIDANWIHWVGNNCEMQFPPLHNRRDNSLQSICPKGFKSTILLCIFRLHSEFNQSPSNGSIVSRIELSKSTLNWAILPFLDHQRDEGKLVVVKLQLLGIIC